MRKRCVAIIPARGGSKRIPKKNIRPFHGKPLIAYSIETAKKSALFDHIVVSTDDGEIAEVARAWGAEVPFMREPEYADDFTPATEAVERTLRRLEAEGMAIGYACTIYPTAPLLDADYLAKGLEKLKRSDAWYAFSAASMPFPIWRTFRLNGEGRCEMFWPEHFATRSQDLEEAYQDAGQFYWERREPGKPPFRFDANALPVLLPRWRVQDIDTPEDWERAEKLYAMLYPDVYDRWNGVKKRCNESEPLKFREGEIFFLSVGMNVGREVDGKGEAFLRPVLVFRKTGRTTFYGIPLTSRPKEGDCFVTFSYKKGKNSTALLHQMRLFDIRRAVYFSGRVRKSDFGKIKAKMGEFFGFTPSRKKGSGPSQKGGLKNDSIITSLRM